MNYDTIEQLIKNWIKKPIDSLPKSEGRANRSWQFNLLEAFLRVQIAFCKAVYGREQSALYRHRSWRWHSVCVSALHDGRVAILHTLCFMIPECDGAENLSTTTPADLKLRLHQKGNLLLFRHQHESWAAIIQTRYKGHGSGVYCGIELLEEKNSQRLMNHSIWELDEVPGVWDTALVSAWLYKHYLEYKPRGHTFDYNPRPVDESVVSPSSSLSELAARVIDKAESAVCVRVLPGEDKRSVCREIVQSMSLGKRLVVSGTDSLHEFLRWTFSDTDIVPLGRIRTPGKCYHCAEFDAYSELLHRLRESRESLVGLSLVEFVRGLQPEQMDSWTEGFESNKYPSADEMMQYWLDLDRKRSVDSFATFKLRTGIEEFVFDSFQPIWKFLDVARSASPPVQIDKIEDVWGPLGNKERLQLYAQWIDAYEESILEKIGRLVAKVTDWVEHKNENVPKKREKDFRLDLQSKLIFLVKRSDVLAWGPILRDIQFDTVIETDTDLGASDGLPPAALVMAWDRAIAILGCPLSAPHCASMLPLKSYSIIRVQPRSSAASHDSIVQFASCLHNHMKRQGLSELSGTRERHLRSHIICINHFEDPMPPGVFWNNSPHGALLQKAYEEAIRGFQPEAEVAIVTTRRLIYTIKSHARKFPKVFECADLVRLDRMWPAVILVPDYIATSRWNPYWLTCIMNYVSELFIFFNPSAVCDIWHPNPEMRRIRAFRHLVLEFDVRNEFDLRKINFYGQPKVPVLPIKAPAYSSTAPKCNVKLACGHLCRGNLKDCCEGRFHVPCNEVCGKLLPYCGHRCRSTCATYCPPCTEPCQRPCSHGWQCNSICGLPCEGCQQSCSWSCPHLRCTRLCSQPCDREICRERCTLTLSCGHQCGGVCGETCPSCRVCSKTQEDSFLLFCTEDLPEARFLLLEDCGHSVELNGLLKWLQVTSADQRSETNMLRCPICRCMILNTPALKKWTLLHQTRYRNWKIQTETVSNIKKMRMQLPRRVRDFNAKLHCYASLALCSDLHNSEDRLWELLLDNDDGRSNDFGELQRVTNFVLADVLESTLRVVLGILEKFMELRSVVIYQEVLRVCETRLETLCRWLATSFQNQAQCVADCASEVRLLQRVFIVLNRARPWFESTVSEANLTRYNKQLERLHKVRSCLESTHPSEEELLVLFEKLEKKVPH
eukprot:Gregarina_sp_Poly_1__3167@NODE_189_length_11663_cov_119_423594_g168_i0_p1_GENE_NODE_189_length_11663_cov_119_423594_g168_i0NODE_189_length_11663_cov_119_423594_g168_i0_p1_ORF_typecomplete_len1177_score119_21LOH1CR12/PF10158_9/3_7e03LOH1CR12/PF10158_9/2_6e03LOH1CR12/PF10158_9/0_81_NODE_189_length_11663_cov_119_423594_g168_i056579187